MSSELVAESSVPVIDHSRNRGSRQERSGRPPPGQVTIKLDATPFEVTYLRTMNASCFTATNYCATFAIHSTHPACRPDCSADAISSCHRGSPTKHLNRDCRTQVFLHQ